MPEKIEAIKEAQCNFLSFLWKHLIAISELQAEGRYYRALERLSLLLDWMPEDFQKKFKLTEKIRKLQKEIDAIQTPEATSFLRQSHTNNLRNERAMELLKDFVPEFAILLDKKGYMERKGGNVEYGTE